MFHFITIYHVYIIDIITIHIVITNKIKYEMPYRHNTVTKYNVKPMEDHSFETNKGFKLFNSTV